jgi:hypothetical protein
VTYSLSQDCSQASVLLGSPSAAPRLLSLPFLCCIPQVPCMLQTRSVMTRSSFVYISHPTDDFLLMLWPPCLQIVMLNFVFYTFYTGLLCFFAIMMMRFSSHSQDFLVPPPLSVPLFALTLPHNLVAAADASGVWSISIYFFFPSALPWAAMH